MTVINARGRRLKHWGAALVMVAPLLGMSGVAKAAPINRCARPMASGPSPSPKIFFITAPPTLSEVSPKGQPKIARKWFSYCEHAHASMV